MLSNYHRFPEPPPGISLLLVSCVLCPCTGSSGEEKHVWLPERLHIEGRLNKRLWLQRKHKDESEANVTPQKDAMASANQTPGGHKFAPLVAVNKGERTSTNPLALGYPLFGPSRHVRAYDCMP